MNDQTPETQRSICQSYAKDIVIAQIMCPDILVDPEVKGILSLIDELTDGLHDHVIKDQLKPMSDAQLTKIDSLLRLVKPEPETLRHINERKFKYNVKEASELIAALQNDLSPESVATKWTDKYSKEAQSVGSNVRKAVQRDEH